MNVCPIAACRKNFDLAWNQIGFTVTISRYADGRLGEIFLASNKAGSSLDAVARDSAILCSLGLQYGVPLDTIRGALLRNADGTPSTPLGAALDRIAAH